MIQRICKGECKVKTQYVLIDGNAIGYSQHLGMTKLSTGDQPTQAIYGFLIALRNLVMPTTHRRIPIVLWDGDASWRKEMLPAYKENRKDPKKQAMKDEYHCQVPFIRKMLKDLNIDQMWSPTCEADDLAGAYSRLLEKKGHPVELVTGDQDWLQLVTANVSWHDPIRDRKVDIFTFEDFTEYANPQRFLEAKCLQGDTSDNIKGVGGIGKVGAKKLLDQFGSVRNMLYGVDEKLPAAWQRLKDNPEPYWLNLKLMSLDGKHQTIWDREINKGEWDPDGFEKTCHELAFFSVTKNIDNWLVPFVNLRGTLV